MSARGPAGLEPSAGTPAAPPAEWPASPAPALGTGEDSAGHALVGSVGPTFAYNVGSQAFVFACGIALARLLTPEEFGLLGMTVIFAHLGGVLANVGLPKALVQAPSLTSEQLRAARTLALLLGAAVAALLVLLSQPIAAFFGRPEVAPLLWVMAANFVVNGAGTVPFALLSRALKLRQLARIDPMAAAVGAIASVALALAGAGVWALVLGVVVSSLTRLVLYSVAGVGGLGGFGLRFETMRPLMKYSAGSLGTAFFGQLTSVIDYALVGRVLTPFALGIYMRALRLVTIPQTQFSMVIGRLLFPYFSRIQDDPQRILRNFLRATCATAVLVLPVLLLLALVAHDFIEVVYGRQWLAAAVPLQILCVTGGIRSISHFARPVLDARGYVHLQAAFQAVYAAALLGSILYAARWGIVGVAAAVAACSVLLDAVLIALLGRAIGLSLRGFGRSLVPGLAASTAALVTAGLVGLLAGPDTPAAVRLLLAVALGGAAALGVLELTPFARRNASYADVRAQIARVLARARGAPAAGAAS